MQLLIVRGDHGAVGFAGVVDRQAIGGEQRVPRLAVGGQLIGQRLELGGQIGVAGAELGQFVGDGLVIRDNFGFARLVIGAKSLLIRRKLGAIGDDRRVGIDRRRRGDR